MKGHLIFNSEAGTGADHATTPAAVSAAFASCGVEVIVRHAAPSELAALAREIVHGAPAAVFVAGGDGTISSVAAQVAGTEIPLGVLPLGTRNHFARDLGLPSDWREAVTQIAAGRVRRIDVGEANDCVFINNVSLGAYPEAVRRREALRTRAGHGKTFATLLAAFVTWRRLPRIRVTIESAQQRRELRTPFVLVSNNEYTEHLLDSNLRSRLDAGRLWIYTTSARRRLTLLRLAWQCLRGRLEDAELDREAVESATIRCSRGPLELAVDGERITTDSTLHLRIRPRALRVFWGAESQPA